MDCLQNRGQIPSGASRGRGPLAADPRCWATHRVLGEEPYASDHDSGSVALLGAPLNATPRVVVSVAKGTVGRVAIRIENASSQDMALSATTYVALLKADSPDRHRPLYWAKVEDQGVPTAARPLRVTGRQSSTVHVDPHASLLVSRPLWTRAGTAYRTVVLPGDYELQVQIVDEQEHWWRSGELPVTVSANGNLRF